jgi:hypothetical protein
LRGLFLFLGVIFFFYGFWFGVDVSYLISVDDEGIDFHVVFGAEDFSIF